ncbi:MAG TPA: PepSY domain-containing protein [Steroidobacteraceae bacterium]|nr:PepSY domain-containing protein [Steroidobacteraceae bacterium]
MINRPLLAGVLALMSLAAGAQQASTPAAPATVLSLGEIESRMTAEGITIREIEVRDSVVEVEGRDAQGREVELLVDRRNGEILSRKLDR